MKNIFLGLLILFSLNTFAQFSGGGGTTVGNVIAENTSYFLDPQVQTNAPTIATPVDLSSTERIWWNVADKTDPNIVYNNTTGTFNLKAGGRYKVTYQVNARYNANQTYQSGVFNYTTNQYEQVSYHTSQTTIQADQIVAGHRRVVGTAIIDATAGARNIGIAFVGGYGSWASYFDATAFTPQLSNAQMAKWNNITIQKISGNIPVTGQTVDYLKVSRITSSQTLALSTDILFNSTPTGNISYNAGTGLATLIAGKTYKIKARLVGRNDGTGGAARYINYGIKTSADADLPTTANSTQGTLVLATSILNEGGGSEATAIFTPTVNTDIKIRITGIDGNNWTLDNERSYLEITQLGSSAVSNFVGATSSTAGTTGFIAAPLAGDQLKVFKADGTYGRGKLVLVSTINTSGTLGGVTFSINTSDPWTLSTSVAATGTTTANVYQFSAGQSWDYWTSATPGVTSILNRGKSWGGTTSGVIGLIGTSYISACTGVLIANGNTYQIQANSYNTGGVCIIEQLN